MCQQDVVIAVLIKLATSTATARTAAATVIKHPFLVCTCFDILPVAICHMGSDSDGRFLSTFSEEIRPG